MAWYEGTLGAGAGALKALLDEKLPLNSYWHIEDPSAGTNIGVYHNYDPDMASDFIVELGDNQANYSICKLWEAWDSVNHVGVGSSVTGYIRKTAGAYVLSVLDHRFVFGVLGGSTPAAHYIGQLRRHDITKNMPVIIAYSASNLSAQNPLGTHFATANIIWMVLKNHNGLATGIGLFHHYYGTSNNRALACFKTSDGRFYLFEDPVICRTTNRQLGFLENVASGNSGVAPEAANGDTILDTENNEWILVVTGTINADYSWIKKV